MKKLFLVVLILFLALPCLASTRQEIQAALDLIRFVNICNDLFDNGVDIADGLIKNNDDSNMTIEVKKELLERTALNIQGYMIKINEFLKSASKDTLATNGLEALEINVANFKADILLMITTAESLETQAKAIVDAADVIAIKNYIESNIDNLPLVREK